MDTGLPEALEPIPVALVAPPRWDSRLANAALALDGGAIAHETARAPRAVLIAAGADGPDRTRTGGHLPTFVVPAAPGPVAAAHAVERFVALAGVPVEALDPAETRAYRCADVPELRPFAGSTLSEEQPRVLPALRPADEVEPLVWCERGSVVVRARRRDVYLSLAPLPDPGVRLLKREFRPECFLGLLPLLLFARAALGEAGWRVPVGPRACFLVDDPNLRSPRYGFLDLRELLAAALERDFHAALAMITLDFRKTREPAARLLREHADRLSLVLHGIDHRKREFEARVSLPAAERALAGALARMDEHRRATGIEYTRAMTFPHGVCGATWMEAMRNVGLEGAFVSRAFPWTDDDELDDPLYELHPAELGFRSFPVVNRFAAEAPKERLLFQAWLGKPLVVYTHHQFFREGVGRLVELADFLNDVAEPRWTDLGAILRSNYQIRRVRDTTAVRLFSNRASLRLDEPSRDTVLLRPGPGLPSGERASVDGVEIEPEEAPGLGLLATTAVPRQAHVDVRFEPSAPPPAPGRLTPPLRSRLRRLAVELRDHGSALLARRG